MPLRFWAGMGTAAAAVTAPDQHPSCFGVQAQIDAARSDYDAAQKLL